MLKLFCILIIILVIVPTKKTMCQNQNPLQAKTISFGGHFSIKSKSADDMNASYNILNVYSQLDIFIFENLSAGLILSYSNEWQGDWDEKELGLGPIFRYYFGTSNVRPFLGAGYLYFSEKWTSMNFDRSESGALFNAGIAIFLSNMVALEPVFNYRIIREKINNQASESDSGWLFRNGKTERTSLTFELAFGIRIYLSQFFK